MVAERHARPTVTTVVPIDWYRTRAPADDLREHLVCVWTARPNGEHLLVPDGCVDVLWFDDGQGWLCGTETAGWTFRVPEGRTAVGLRFRAGMAPAALGFAGHEVANRRVRLQHVVSGREHRHLTQELADNVDPAARTRVVEAAARRWLAAPARPVDTVARAAVATAADRGRLRVDELATQCNLSSRQLHRRCLDVFGYGPSTLTRILRLQRFLNLGRSPAAGLAALAAHAGYADQAHLARECRALTGLTPRALLQTDLPR